MPRARLLEEVWVRLDEFPTYAVSNYGKVLHIRLDNPIPVYIDSYGFVRVNLWHDGRNYNRLVHRLVAAAFLSDFRPYKKVKHADGNKQNNFVENIRPADNRDMPPLKTNQHFLQPSRIEVVETGTIYRSVSDLAEAEGMLVSNIYKVLNGKRNSHKGLTVRRIGDR